MKLSIRNKFLLVLGSLLLAAVGFYTALASFIFRQEKTALLFDINHSLAVNASSHFRAEIQQIGNKLQVFGLSRLMGAEHRILLPSDFLKKDNVIATAFINRSLASIEQIKWENTAGDKTPILDIDKLKSNFSEAEKQGICFFSSGTPQKPEFFILVPHQNVHQKNDDPSYILAALDGQKIFAPITSSLLYESYLVTDAGNVILRFNKGALETSSAITQHPLVKTISEKGRLASGVSSFELQDQTWYGAYSYLGIGNLFFISQASQTEVESAILLLLKRSLHFGIIVATVTLLLSILFSRRLTKQLQRLTRTTKRITEGNLQLKVHIHSGDEIEELANSFNLMIHSLRESRDRIQKHTEELESRVEMRTRELLEKNVKIKEVQEALIRNTELAAVGEVAGRAAHEVLNPLTGIATRTESILYDFESEKSKSLAQEYSAILDDWSEQFSTGGIEKLKVRLATPSQVSPNQTLFEEDLNNLKMIGSEWTKSLQKLHEAMDFIQTQTHRIHRIIDGMRRLGRASTQKSVVHCHKELRNAVSTLSDYLKKQGVKLELQFRASSDSALLNQDELIQIISNLIRNANQAIQANSEKPSRKEGCILLATGNQGDRLLVDVIDNGIGIPKESIGSLFDQGFTTKDPNEGTGFGLSICRRYARAFGGEVELLYSDKERGTCFRLTIPLYHADSQKLAV